MNFREMLALIREDHVAHGRDWSRPGLRAIAVHRFGNWRMSIRSKLLRAPFSFLYRRAYFHCRNVYGIELPYTVELGRRVVIEHQGGIVIHGSVRIGDDCIIRQNCTLGVRTIDQLSDAPMLAERVELGAGAVLLGAIRIGAGAQIGANAVVLKEVPEGALAVGVPARIIVRRMGTAEH